MRIAVTGSPLPVQMHNEVHLFENSYCRNPRNVDALSEPKGAYLFYMTFGRAGIFALYPMTLLGLLPAFISKTDGQAMKAALRVKLEGRLKLELHGSGVTSDAEWIV